MVLRRLSPAQLYLAQLHCIQRLLWELLEKLTLRTAQGQFLLVVHVDVQRRLLERAKTEG